MRRVLLFGGSGQLGWELQRALAPLGELTAPGRTAPAQAGPCGDLTQVERLTASVEALRPHVVVNAAAYTAVDRAESDREAARIVNAQAPGALAAACASVGALLVHYSTDYVFDGSGDVAWREDDRTGPINVYGQTKLEGEKLVRDSGCRHLILRTSWVYAARGTNFVRTMLRLASERDELGIVDDQFGAPTGAELLADATAHALNRMRGRDDLGGTYHVAAAGVTSWFDYARLVIEQARAVGWRVRVAQEHVRPVPSRAYPTAAQRPRNSRLDCSRFERAFELRLPAWDAGVRRVVAELTERD